VAVTGPKWGERQFPGLLFLATFAFVANAFRSGLNLYVEDVGDLQCILEAWYQPFPGSVTKLTNKLLPQTVLPPAQWSLPAIFDELSTFLHAYADTLTR
jgi:hypothetical protein